MTTWGLDRMKGFCDALPGFSFGCLRVSVFLTLILSSVTEMQIDLVEDRWENFTAKYSLFSPQQTPALLLQHVLVHCPSVRRRTVQSSISSICLCFCMWPLFSVKSSMNTTVNWCLWKPRRAMLSHCTRMLCASIHNSIQAMLFCSCHSGACWYHFYWSKKLLFWKKSGF